MFNRTLRALKSHPNARHDDDVDEGVLVVDYEDGGNDGDEEVEEEKVPIPGWMIFVQIQDILEQGRNLFLRRSHRPRPSLCHLHHYHCHHHHPQPTLRKYILENQRYVVTGW